MLRNRAEIWTEAWCGFPGSSVGKESAHNAGDQSLIPGSGRSLGEGNGNPLQYSCLRNAMDRGAWRATIRGITREGHNSVTEQQQIFNEFPIIISIIMCQYLLCTLQLESSPCSPQPEKSQSNENPAQPKFNELKKKNPNCNCLCVF